MELIKVDDEVDEYVLLDIGELDVDAVEGEEELLSSTGRVVELVVNDVPSVVGVVTVVVLDDVDVFSVVGVIVVELDEEVDDVVDEELSSASEDVELVLDKEVEGEPIGQSLINIQNLSGFRQSIFENHKSRALYKLNEERRWVFNGI